MHAMSYRFHFCLACSSIVNILEPAFYSTITSHLTASQLDIRKVQNTTTILDSQSLNTLMLEVLLSSNNECDIIRDLSDLGLQIICDTWWASLNARTNCCIASDDSGHTASWRF